MTRMRIEAMPRIPRLPEGITWESTAPGYYHFKYPWPGDRYANVWLERKRDDYGNSAGPMLWFWSWLGFYTYDTPEGFRPVNLSDAGTDGGWPTMESCLADVLRELERVVPEIEEYDRREEDPDL